MTTIGLENVHAEKCQIWRGWTKGTAATKMVSPVHRKPAIDAMGWTGLTQKGEAEAEVTVVNPFRLERRNEKVVTMARPGTPPGR
jgi:hypothetical protein